MTQTASYVISKILGGARGSVPNAALILAPFIDGGRPTSSNYMRYFEILASRILVQHCIQKRLLGKAERVRSRDITLIP